MHGDTRVLLQHTSFWGDEVQQHCFIKKSLRLKERKKFSPSAKRISRTLIKKMKGVKKKKGETKEQKNS